MGGIGQNSPGFEALDHRLSLDDIAFLTGRKLEAQCALDIIDAWCRVQASSGRSTLLVLGGEPQQPIPETLQAHPANPYRH